MDVAISRYGGPLRGKSTPYNVRQFHRYPTRMHTSVSGRRTAAAVVLCLLVVTTGGAVSVPVAATDAAAATQITSCQEIDSPGSYVLADDLRGEPSSPCLTVSADDVSLSGDGHVVEPTRTPASGPAIAVADAENVSVTGLTLVDWQTGLSLRGVDGGSVTDVTVVSADVVGVSLAASTRNVTLDRLTVRRSTAGVELADATDVELSGSEFATLTGTAVTVGDGVERATARNNTVVGSSGVGVHVDGARDVTVADNTVVGTADAGIDVTDARTVTVADNVVRRAATGVRATDSPGVRVTNNTVSDSGLQGIHYRGPSNGTADHWWHEDDDPELSSPLLFPRDAAVQNNTVTESDRDGIVVTDASYLLVRNNTVERNDDGITVNRSSDLWLHSNDVRRNRDDGMKLGYALSSEVRGNDVVRNGDDGVYVVGNDNALLENTVRRNLDDGIDLQNASRTVLRGNLVERSIDDGLFLRNANDSVVRHNEIWKNGDEGIDLRRSYGNVVRTNEVCLNTDDDVHVRLPSSGNDVADNRCHDPDPG